MIDYNVLLSERIDIVELVSKYTKLNKRGDSYIGLCPIHSEDSPSFNINKPKCVYHCFGCNSGGNVISFIMAINNIDFLGAVNILCEMYNIDINNDTNNDTNNNADIINRLNSNLKQNKKALKYLKDRKITDNTIEFFKLGTLLNTDNDILFEKKELFYNRIIIPIQDKNGKYAAIAGRSINDGKPKYINSSGKIYNKNEFLYGFYNAKEHIKNSKTSIIVEGYFDVIKMWQFGIKNVVACCSSYISEEQIKTLLPLSEKIILCFDGDSAGLNANIKAIENCLKLNIKPHVCLLENGDPDSIIDKGNLQYINNQINNTISIIDFLLLFYKYEERNKKYFLIETIINKSVNTVLKNDLLREFELKIGIVKNKEIKLFSYNKNEYFYTVEGAIISYFFYNYNEFLKHKQEVLHMFSRNDLTQKLINVLYYNYDGSIENIQDNNIKQLVLNAPEIEIDINNLINKLKKYEK